MKNIALLSFLLLFISCSDEQAQKAVYEVIPLPQKIDKIEGQPFLLKNSTQIAYKPGDTEAKQQAEMLVEYLDAILGYRLGITEDTKLKNIIELRTDNSMSNPEGYNLIVDKDKITINGASYSGLFYGIQTLRKSILPALGKNIVELPAIEITDYPRFPYRGVHLDIARHFESVDFIKKFIDMLALHNENKLHLHLTDDQGWRIEIKKHPELAEVGSKRKATIIGKTEEYDNKPYGGYLTQEEIKEIVKYASERYITVIPEIDLPGHMVALLASHPELSCTGNPIDVWGRWGVSDEVLCAGNEDVYNMLEDIFDEVIELFPSEYIHIGGDECPKSRWEKCPKCQAKIKSLKLHGDKEYTAEHKLQSYFVGRIADYVNKKGRKVIGWDEVLEGGAPDGITIMAWRGVDKGNEAAKKGHQVIMTPVDYCYFDYYQTLDRNSAPLTIGGYVPLEKVYSFEPVSPGLSAEEGKLIQGVQANTWSEYMTSIQHREYMLIPRIDALAEVQWSDPSKKNYEAFVKRLLLMTNLYDKLGYNYATNFLDIKSQISKDENGNTIVSLSSYADAPIHYTLDGSDPTLDSPLYTASITINKTETLKAQAFSGTKKGTVFEQKFTFSKSTNKPIELLKGDLSKKYTFGGVQDLVNGIQGGVTYFDEKWIGFLGDQVDLLVDLGQKEPISEIKIGTFINVYDWIFGITKVVISISDNNKEYKTIFSKTYPEVTKTTPEGRFDININLKEGIATARYLKIDISKSSKLPDWHPGKGSQPYLFLDEIEIN